MGEVRGGGVGIHHIALRVEDVARAEAFYRGMFGLPLLERVYDGTGRLRSVWLAVGPSVLMLERNLIVDGAGGSGHVVVFETGDLGAFAERAAELGHAIVARTARSLYVKDPDGHVLGVSSYDFGTAGGGASHGSAAPASRDSAST